MTDEGSQCLKRLAPQITLIPACVPEAYGRMLTVIDGCRRSRGWPRKYALPVAVRECVRRRQNRFESLCEAHVPVSPSCCRNMSWA